MQAAMKEHLDRRLQHRALQSLVAFITAASIVACEGRPPKDRFDDVKSPSIAFLRAFMSLDVDYVEIRAVGYADAVDFARFRSYAVDPRLQKTGPKVESLTVVNLETIDGNPYHLAVDVRVTLGAQRLTCSAPLEAEWHPEDSIWRFELGTGLGTCFDLVHGEWEFAKQLAEIRDGCRTADPVSLKPVVGDQSGLVVECPGDFALERRFYWAGRFNCPHQGAAMCFLMCGAPSAGTVQTHLEGAGPNPLVVGEEVQEYEGPATVEMGVLHWKGRSTEDSILGAHPARIVDVFYDQSSTLLIVTKTWLPPM